MNFRHEELTRDLVESRGAVEVLSDLRRPSELAKHFEELYTSHTCVAVADHLEAVAKEQRLEGAEERINQFVVKLFLVSIRLL